MKRILPLIAALVLTTGCFMNSSKVKILEMNSIATRQTNLAKDNQTYQTELSNQAHNTKSNWNVSEFNEAEEAVQDLMNVYLADGGIDAEEAADLLLQQRKNINTYNKAQNELNASRESNYVKASELKERGDLLAKEMLELVAFSEAEKAAQMELWKSIVSSATSFTAPTTPEVPDSGTIEVEENN